MLCYYYTKFSKQLFFWFRQKQKKTKQKSVNDIIFIIFRDKFYWFVVCPRFRESSYVSDYFEDQGREMKDLKWTNGEPTDDGKYIRLNTDVYRLEVTPGTLDRSKLHMSERTALTKHYDRYFFFLSLYRFKIKFRLFHYYCKRIYFDLLVDLIYVSWFIIWLWYLSLDVWLIVVKIILRMRNLYHSFFRGMMVPDLILSYTVGCKFFQSKSMTGEIYFFLLNALLELFFTIVLETLKPKN